MNDVLAPPVSITPPPPPGADTSDGAAPDEPTPNVVPPDTTTQHDARLVRPRDGRVLGGVCAGLADRYGWGRRTTRVLAVVSLLLPGPQVLLYLGLWLFVPDGGDGKRIVDLDKVRHDVDDIVGSRSSTA